MTLSRTNPRATSRWTLLVSSVVALTFLAAGLVLANHGGATSIPANYAPFTVTDQQLANDVPGQVDLTQMGRDDTDTNTYRLFWSWDSRSSWTGTGQTGDACALFDNDNNTFIDFVVCVRVENFNANPNDVRILLNSGQPAFFFSCSDKKNDRCTNPTPVPYLDSQLQGGALGTTPLNETGNLITHTDPFPAGESNPDDSTVEIHILKALIPGNEVLVNVCSYPSAGNGGNNNPFDCIVSPGGGFLRVVKAATGTAPNFTFSAARGSTTLATFTSAGAGIATVNPQPSTVTLLPLLVDPQSGANLVVTETNIPSPWALSAVSCKVPPGAGGTSTGSADVANAKITAVSIQSGLVTECTFTDALQTGTLIVIKEVTNDNGGLADADDWTYNVNESPDQGALGSVQTAGAPGNSHTLTAGTTYNVVENAGGPAGYTVSYSTDCTGTIQAGGTKTCTITNDDNAPSLTLVKAVTNDNGGTALPSAWTLTATGPTGFSGAGPSVSNGTSFDAGTYDLSESGGPAGYTASAWVCTGTGSQGDSDTVSLDLGESATCTITNDDNGSSLTLVKAVTNDNGGTALPSAWTLTATGPTGFSGAGPSVSNGTSFDAGTYDLSESGGPAGYTASAWVCTGTGTQDDSDTVSLDLGESATCTITNDDNAPALTLVKAVTNDNGDDATPAQWTLTATGPTGFSGAGPSVSNGTSFDAGTYDLSESGPSDYDASAWVCTGTGTQDDSDTVSLDLGESATCTITNDDRKAEPAGATVQSWVLHDSLTITGIRAGATDQDDADAIFRLYDDDDCAVEDLVGTRTDTTIDFVGSTGEAATPTGIAVTESGFYYWTVEYEGDQFNEGFTTDCGDEITQILAKDAFEGGRDDFAP